MAIKLPTLIQKIDLAKSAEENSKVITKINTAIKRNLERSNITDPSHFILGTGIRIRDLRINDFDYLFSQELSRSLTKRT